MFFNKPIFGYGWDYTAITFGKTTHSSYLQLISELGLFGLLIEIYIFITLFKSFNFISSYTNKHNNILFYFNLCFTSAIFSFVIWMFFSDFQLFLGLKK